MLSTIRRWFGVSLLGLCAGSAWADEWDWLTIEGDYLIGASVVSGTGHVGEAPLRYDLQPMWAFQLGPFRVSRSRGSSLMKAGREELETGVSANFGLFDNWRLGASLRMDSGRDFEPGSRLYGLPSIPSTLRGRVSTGSALGPRWSWSSSYDKDLLGRNGGSRLSGGLNYHYPLDEKRYLDLGLGATWGDKTYLQTHYGITPETAQRTGRDPYRLGGGPENLRIGLQYTHVLADEWVLFGGLDISRLLSAPSRSPLVGRVTTHTISAGIGYRGKR